MGKMNATVDDPASWAAAARNTALSVVSSRPGMPRVNLAPDRE
jgi:hypothetical protein